MLKKTAAGTVLGGAMLVGGGLGLAHAAPPAPEAQTTGDGMVNVTVNAGSQEIGVLRDVTITNAAALATSVCPLAGIDSNALTNLDNTGTVPTGQCTGTTGLSFSFAQNGAVNEGAGGNNGNGNGGGAQQGNSQYAPGHNKAPGAETPSATPGTPPGQQGQQNG